MNRFFQLLGALIALATTFFVLFFLWRILFALPNVIAKANATVLAAIVAGVATVLANLWSAFYNQKKTREHSAEEAHRDRKVQIYNNFITILSHFMSADNPNINVPAAPSFDPILELYNFKVNMILWCSPQVIKAQRAFEHASSSPSKPAAQMMAMNALLLAIRRDLGLPTKTLTDTDLVKLFLRDPDELDIIRATKQ